MGLLIKLVTGDTALKSLKFGKDRFGGGSSNQPYIKNPIIDEPGKLSQADNDFLLRGGLRAPLNAAEDVARLTKYMFDFKSPSGFLFGVKQNLLSRVAVPTEASISFGYGNSPSKDLAWTKAPLNQGIYTPLSTLLQAGVGFTGTHLNLLGINPFTPMTGVVQGGFLPSLGLIRYEDVVRGKTRLTKTIEVEKWVPNPNPPKSVSSFDYNPSSASSSRIKVKEKQKVPIGQFENRLIYLWGKDMTNTNNAGGNLLEYSGGPGSILGIGKTRIKFGDLQRTGINNLLANTENNYFYKGGVRLHEFDSPDQWRLPIGASSKYIEYTKKFVPYDLIKGNNSYEEIDTPKLFKPGTLEPALTLTGSDGYQIGKKSNLTTESDTTYYSPIEDILNNTYDRQLLSPPQFDDGKQTGDVNVWAATTNGKLIPKYSSENTLRRDYTNQDISSSGGYLWVDFNDPAKTTTVHKEGYLADLDKNAGSYKGDNGEIIYFNNGYPGGIAPDFRLTPREKRGLSPFNQFNENPSQPDNLPKYNSGKGEDYTRWINDNGSLSGKALDTIYYNSNSVNKSSFRTSNNPFNSGADDIIKFRIKVIDPRNPSNNLTTLNFRAYIDSISDSYSADWKSQTYMGRAEKFYKYNGFDRDMSLSFTVVADNSTNLNAMYDQLNTLAASLAPTYTTYGYMAGNLHSLTVGNYVYDQPGIIQSVGFDIMDESPWQIEGKQNPFYIKVDLKFTPIHKFRPESQFNKTHQFIDQTTT